MLDIVFGLIAAFLSGLALFLQKCGIKKMFFSPKWLLGTFLTAVSFSVYIFALKLGGRLVIIQPLLNVSVIFLVIMEIVFLKNKVKKYEVLSLVLFFLGLIVLQVKI
jgi:uncharacterized membrane protein